MLSQSPQTAQFSVKMLFLSLNLDFPGFFFPMDFIPLVKIPFEMCKYVASIMDAAATTVSGPESGVGSVGKASRRPASPRPSVGPYTQ